jgi:hypothetical protein
MPDRAPFRAPQLQASLEYLTHELVVLPSGPVGIDLKFHGVLGVVPVLSSMRGETSVERIAWAAPIAEHNAIPGASDRRRPLRRIESRLAVNQRRDIVNWKRKQRFIWPKSSSPEEEPKLTVRCIEFRKQAGHVPQACSNTPRAFGALWPSPEVAIAFRNGIEG